MLEDYYVTVVEDWQLENLKNDVLPSVILKLIGSFAETNVICCKKNTKFSHSKWIDVYDNDGHKVYLSSTNVKNNHHIYGKSKYLQTYRILSGSLDTDSVCYVTSGTLCYNCSGSQLREIIYLQSAKLFYRIGNLGLHYYSNNNIKLLFFY